ncbi:MAG: NYN domain-containing protein [Candidatus Taylorbacteria bacterium]|nr:NYN domain-containing protein [Candidatus Taylorbacteria bacterium]
MIIDKFKPAPQISFTKILDKKENNFAFIDSQNVNLSINGLGWEIDWKKLRIYLEDKYDVTKAYIFIGYKSGNESLYTFLQSAGYICIFKPTLELPDGKVKGNVAAELVLHAMIELNNFDKAVITSGDGDFYCLAEYLLSKGKLKKILAPNQARYSSLLNKLSTPENNVLDFISNLREKIEYIKTENEKGSPRDRTL